MKKILIFLGLSIPMLLIAQVNIDSLCKAVGDKSAAIQLADLADESMRTSPRLALLYGSQGLELARKTENFDAAIDLANTVGRTYTILGQYDSALAFFFQAEGFCERIGDDREHAAVNANIAAAYTYQKDYKRALRYYNKAQESDDLPLRRRVYHNLASIYLDQGDFEKALDYFSRSLAISEARGDSSEMGYTYNMLGETYRQTKEYNKSQVAFEKALDIFEPKGELFGKVVVLNNLGTLYLDQENLEKALPIYRAALEVNADLGNQEAEVTLLTNLGVIHRTQGEYSRAMSYYEKALAQARENSYPNRILKCLQEIHETLSLQKKFEEAYAIQSEYQTYKDELDEQMAEERILQLQLRFENKEKENEILRQETEIQQLTLDRQRQGLIFVAAALVLAGLLAFFIFSRFRITQKLNRSLEDRSGEIQRQNEKITASNFRLIRANQELKEFAYIVSHDLKEPLRMIGSYVTLLRRRYFDQLDEDGKEFIEFTVSGVKRMKLLLDDLLRYMVVETDEYHPEDVDLEEVLSTVKANLLSRVEESDATLEIDPMPALHSNRALLVLLFQNLISNALKFRGTEAPVVRVKVARQKDRYLFTIEDNGIGIPEKYQDRIFSIFYRVNSRYEYEGTGIGLSISQKIVALHNGKIWVKSEEGKGTTFFMTLGDMGS